MTDRALVLGGGGSVGNAWLIGVIAGLFDTGLDLTDAELIIGTSAGSTAAAQISSSARPPRLFADILASTSAPAGKGADPHRSGGPRPAASHMERTDAIFASASDVADLRRRIGAAALEMDAESGGSIQMRWRATVASRLPNEHWPEQRIHIVVVDAVTGERVVFDRDSGVELADAVAASTANGFGVPPYRIGERWYIDGGYPSADNADLADAYGRVLVLSPFGGRSRAPLKWGVHLTAHVEELRSRGSKVETIVPDDRSIEAFGFNMMDASARPASAQAGFNQGKALATHLTGFWRC